MALTTAKIILIAVATINLVLISVLVMYRKTKIAAVLAALEGLIAVSVAMFD